MFLLVWCCSRFFLLSLLSILLWTRDTAHNHKSNTYRCSPSPTPTHPCAFAFPTTIKNDNHELAGVVTRSSQYRRASRDRRCREYFYGGGASAVGGAPALSPAALHLDFNDVSIFRVGGQTVSDAMLPVGHSDSSLGPLQVYCVVWLCVGMCQSADGLAGEGAAQGLGKGCTH